MGKEASETRKVHHSASGDTLDRTRPASPNNLLRLEVKMPRQEMGMLCAPTPEQPQYNIKSRPNQHPKVTLQSTTAV